MICIRSLAGDSEEQRIRSRSRRSPRTSSTTANSKYNTQLADCAAIKHTQSELETITADLISTHAGPMVTTTNQTSTQLVDEEKPMYNDLVLSASIGGVIGGLLGLCLIIVIIALLVIVKRRHSEKQSENISGDDIKGYNNAVYDGMFIICLTIEYNHIYSATACTCV